MDGRSDSDWCTGSALVGLEALGNIPAADASERTSMPRPVLTGNLTVNLPRTFLRCPEGQPTSATNLLGELPVSRQCPTFGLREVVLGPGRYRGLASHLLAHRAPDCGILNSRVGEVRERLRKPQALNSRPAPAVRMPRSQTGDGTHER